MHKQLEQVLEFHQVFSCHTETAPTVALPSEVPEVRCRLMHEELDEYRDAVEAGDIVGVADALSETYCTWYSGPTYRTASKKSRRSSLTRFTEVTCRNSMPTEMCS